MVMLARDIVPILAIFSVSITLGFIFIGGINANYDMDIDTSWQSTYDHLDTTKQLSDDVESKVNTDQQGIIPDQFEILFTGTINVIELIFDSLGTFSDIVKNSLKDIGLPKEVTRPIGIAINAIIISMIVFVVVSSVLKKRL